MAALGAALRLIWHCPADLVQRAQNACAALSAFDPDALRETAEGYGPLEDWLKRAEEWSPPRMQAKSRGG
jgi:hypothetical protein